MSSTIAQRIMERLERGRAGDEPAEFLDGLAVAADIAADEPRALPPLLPAFPRDVLGEELDERERHAFDEYELAEVEEWRKVVASLTDEELRHVHELAADEILDALPMSPDRYLLDSATWIAANRKVVADA